MSSDKAVDASVVCTGENEHLRITRGGCEAALEAENRGLPCSKLFVSENPLIAQRRVLRQLIGCIGVLNDCC